MRIIRSKVWDWVLIVAAVLMLGLMLIPSNFWHKPEYEYVFEGFDPALVSVHPDREDNPAGLIRIDNERLELNALPGTEAAAELFTYAYAGSFDINFLATIQEAQTGTVPLRITISNVSENSQLILSYSSKDERSITAQISKEGQLIDTEYLSNYPFGVPHNIQVYRNTEEGVLVLNLEGTDKSLLIDKMPALEIIGGPDNPQEYAEVCSPSVPVSEGHIYEFGAYARRVFGSGWFKFVLYWYDDQGNILGSVNDWQAPEKEKGWFYLKYRGEAPVGTTHALIVLGAGSGKTVMLYSGIFISEEGKSDVNLIPDTDFSDISLWTLAGDTPIAPDETPVVLRAQPEEQGTSLLITREEAPEFFYETPLSLSVSSISQGGLATAILTDFSVKLPIQKMAVQYIDDQRVRAALIGLLAVAVLLLGRLIVRGVLHLRLRERWVEIKRNGIRIEMSAKSLWILAAVAVSLIIGGLLFRYGSHIYDLWSEQLWSYIPVAHGLPDLDHLSSIVTIPEMVGGTGVPIGSPGFPYGPLQAEFFTVAGYFYKLFLSQPSGFIVHSFALEFVIKSFNMIFVVANAVLIYFILRKTGLRRSIAYLGSAFFLLNPAVIFMSALWGETHAFSIFFLLLSILLALYRKTGGAWATLAMVVLTRPQLVIPAFIVGLAYLAWFNWKDNVRGAAWSIMALFLLILPFSLGGISPSYPLDFFRQVLFVHGTGGTEFVGFQFVSNDGYNLWSLVTSFKEGLAGRESIYWPANNPLIGSLSYRDVASLITLSLVGLLSLLSLASRRLGLHPHAFIILAAAGLYGLVVFKTGLSVHHYMLALPLILVAWRFLGTMGTVICAGLLTLTTFVGMAGSLGFGGVELGSLYNPTGNAVTRFFMDWYASDYFVTFGSIVNVLIFVWIFWRVIRVLFRRERPIAQYSGNKGEVEPG